MKDNKIIDAVKDVKVSDIQKAVRNIWKLSVFCLMVFMFIVAVFSIDRGGDSFTISICILIPSAFEFFTGKITSTLFGFVTKDRN